MRSLLDLKDRHFLVAVAHPDDETLWFLQSLLTLQTQNRLQLFCATYGAESNRGRELNAVAKQFGFAVEFGGCEDRGIDRLLRENEVKRALNAIHARCPFHAVITHPLTGGEKPHPHHIQMHLYALEYAVARGIGFGFFSDRELLDKVRTSEHYHYSARNKSKIFQCLLRCYHQLAPDEDKLLFLTSVLNCLTQADGSYLGFETKVNLATKRAALSLFTSQTEVLRHYAAFSGDTELLYLSSAIGPSN